MPASIELMLGTLLLSFGLILGLVNYVNSQIQITATSTFKGSDNS